MKASENLDHFQSLTPKENMVTAFNCYCFIVFAYFVFSEHLGWHSLDMNLTLTLLFGSAIQCAILFCLLSLLRKVRFEFFQQIPVFGTVFIVLQIPVFILYQNVFPVHNLSFFWNIQIVVIWVGLYKLCQYIYLSGKYRNRERQLHALTAQAHMRVLADQLSPHFVFNALNNLRFMLSVDAQRARQMSLDISDIITEIDAYLRHDLIPIKQELQVLEKYLRLVQLGDHIKIKTKLRCDNPNKLVLPMILQLLVENCVKHCLNKLEHGQLGVYVRQYKDILVYRVWCTNSLNPKIAHAIYKSKNYKQEPENEFSGIGIGINNIRQRLSLFYGDSHRYRFRENQKHISTLIVFPVQTEFGEHLYASK